MRTRRLLAWQSLILAGSVRSSCPRWLRRAALLNTLVFGWTFTAFPPVYALTHQPKPKREGVRTLKLAEMDKIIGKTNPTVPQTGSTIVNPTGSETPANGKTWDILNSSNTIIADSTTTNGWNVQVIGSGAVQVSAPGSALLGTYKYRLTGRGSAYFDTVQPAASLFSGSTYPWEAAFPAPTFGGPSGTGRSSGGGLGTGNTTSGGSSSGNIQSHMVNSVNGNKLTAIPIVGWTARGGLPVSLSLVHNSESNQNLTLGYKWTHTFDIYGLVDGSGNFTVHWGDDLSYTFAKSGSNYTAPAGIFDKLVKNVDGTYTLTTKNQVKYNFNTAIRCSTIVDANGNTITLGYNAGNYVTSITDPTNRAITIAYNGSNKISTITDPLSRVWTMHYDGSGNLSSVDLPVINSTTYNYVFTYNAAHDITDLATPRGKHWTFSYFADNSLQWAKDPYSNETDFNYTATSKTMKDPNGNVTTFTYDTSGRVTQEKDPLTYHADYTSYTSNFQPQTVTDKRGYNWALTYDSAGNVLTAKDPYLNTYTMTYNSHNRLLTVTIPTGEQTVFTYDTHDNLTQVDHKDSGGTIQATETYTVNGYGQTTDFYDANSHHYTYGYNTNGHLTSQTTPLGNNTTWTYDALGRIATRTKNGVQTLYTLDAWERLTVVDYGGNLHNTYAYDADNNLTQHSHGVNITIPNVFTYDDAGRLTGESYNGNTIVSYTYDSAGKKGLLSTITDSNGRVITYSYTTRNQLYQVSETAGTAAYSYDANSNLTGLTNQNGTTVTYGYDNASRLTSVTNKNSSNTVLSSFSYTLDTDGRRHVVTEANGDTVTYTYDWGSRLTQEVRTGANAYTKSYTLDDVGNRTSQTVGGVSTTFTYDSDDELTAASGGFTNSYTYNSNGEQTSRTLSGTTYTLNYDLEGNLASIVSNGSTLASFATDAIGRRIERTSGGVLTAFQYAGNAVLLEKQGGTTTATYTYGNALLRKDGEYPMFDGLGSERTVTNSSQTVTGTLTLDGFGQTVATTGSSTNPYMFGATSGYRTEGDAGLMHVGARYYDAQVGRFTTRDTDLSQHPYIYCYGDPINYVDPSGHVSTILLKAAAIIGAIGAVVGAIGLVNPPAAVAGTLIRAFAGFLVLISLITDDNSEPHGLGPGGGGFGEVG